MARLFFAGDVYLEHRDRITSICGADIEDIMSGCDLCCCNLEGSIARKDKPFPKAPKAGPALIQSENAAEILLRSGFNAFTMANNHIMDYGEEAVRYTQEKLAGTIMGGVVNQPEYIEATIDGMKIALFAVAENCFGCEMCTDGMGYLYFLRKGLFPRIREARDKGNYVIINVHAGAEMLDIPLPELREIYRAYVDAGAGLVVGHHPHVLQGYEDYHGSRIYYSLGNFCFDREQEPICTVGGAATVTIRPGSEAVHEAYVTEYKDGIVRLYRDQAMIGRLSAKLDNEKEVGQWCLKQYKEVIFPIFYRGNAFGIWDRSLAEKCKMAVKILTGRVRTSDMYMAHNVNNDTNYWVTRRALSLIMRDAEE